MPDPILDPASSPRPPDASHPAASPSGTEDTMPKDAPRWLVVLLAVLSLLLASGLAFWMIFAPANAEPPQARFWLCFSISLYMTLFFFVVLWRQQDLVMFMKLPAWLSDAKVKLTGP